MLLRRTVQVSLNKDLIIWINPSLIDYYVGSEIPYIRFVNAIFRHTPRLKLFAQRLVYHAGPFTFSDSLYPNPLPLEKLDKFIKVKNLIENLDDYKKSNWYSELHEQIKNNGYAEHKHIIIKSVNELDDFFSTYVLGLVNSMKESGYILQKGRDLGYIMIDKDGVILKSNASNHRFFVAKLLGVKSMPFKIKGVHEKWLSDQGIPNSRKGLPQLVKAIKKFEKQNQ